jgi:hypothetical protein
LHVSIRQVAAISEPNGILVSRRAREGKTEATGTARFRCRVSGKGS